jgi:hypothetical protein
MDYDSIVGGIGEPLADTITHGGVAHVVNGYAKAGCRDKLIQLKHVPNDTPMLIAIIGISQPLVFGRIDYDDGEEKMIISRKASRTTPDEALESKLREILTATPAKLEAFLVSMYKLHEPMIRALLEVIELLIHHSHTKKTRVIKIDGEIGWLLDRIPDGGAYFEIDTDGQGASTLADVLERALDGLECLASVDDANVQLIRPTWPEISNEAINKLDELAKGDMPSIRAYVEAIVMRECALVDHMDAVEQYYADIARDIQTYTEHLHRAITQCPMWARS